MLHRKVEHARQPITVGVLLNLCYNNSSPAFKDSNGMTVLHLAAKKCHVDIIDLLMETRTLNIDEQVYLTLGETCGYCTRCSLISSAASI